MTTESITPVPAAPKTVPESDLLAVKAGAVKKEAELSNRITELTALISEKDNALGVTQLETSTLKSRLAEVETLKTELETSRSTVSEATAKAEAAIKSLAERDSTIMGMRKAGIIVALDLKPDDPKLKAIQDETNLASLEALEKALGFIGRSPKSPGFFVSGGPGGSTPKSSHDKIKAGFAAGELN